MAYAGADSPQLAARTPRAIDRLCEDLFLSRKAREQDDNLLFVRERLLRNEGDLAALLELYRAVRNGRRVVDDETNPLVGILRLSGVVRLREGCLWVRNRIYYRVFDQAWVRQNMPDAELRRQRAAYRRGLARAAAVAAVIVAMMGGLVLVALGQTRRAEAAKAMARRSLYVANVNLAEQAVRAGNLGRAAQLLDAVAPRDGDADLRGFEWRYFRRLCRDESVRQFRGHTHMIRGIAVSPDGSLLATASADHTARLWQIAPTARQWSRRRGSDPARAHGSRLLPGLLTGWHAPGDRQR